jgi:hypothetical protein
VFWGVEGGGGDGWHPGGAEEGVAQGGQDVGVVFGGGGDVAADGVAVPGGGLGAEAAGDLVLGFGGAQVAFGLVAGGRDAEVGGEAQDVVLAVAQYSSKGCFPGRRFPRSRSDRSRGSFWYGLSDDGALEEFRESLPACRSSSSTHSLLRDYPVRLSQQPRQLGIRQPFQLTAPNRHNTPDACRMATRTRTIRSYPPKS